MVTLLMMLQIVVLEGKLSEASDIAAKQQDASSRIDAWQSRHLAAKSELARHEGYLLRVEQEACCAAEGDFLKWPFEAVVDYISPEVELRVACFPVQAGPKLTKLQHCLWTFLGFKNSCSLQSSTFSAAGARQSRLASKSHSSKCSSTSKVMDQ